MNKKYLYLSVLSLGMIACGETSDVIDETVDSVVEAVDSTETIEEESVTTEDYYINKYSKFNDYATILNKEDLIAEFGKENTVDKESWYGEGSTKKESTVLTNPYNGHIVKFVWDDENDYKLDWIEANHYKWGDDYENMGTQVIEAENGLKLGMSLQDLVVWNGEDIEFSGFGWDFAGGITRKEGSKISNSKVIIRLMDDQSVKDEKWDFMSGDVPLNSADEKLKDAPVLIEQFTLFVDEVE